MGSPGSNCQSSDYAVIEPWYLSLFPHHPLQGASMTPASLHKIGSTRPAAEEKSFPCKSLESR